MCTNLTHKLSNAYEFNEKLLCSSRESESQTYTRSGTASVIYRPTSTLETAKHSFVHLSVLLPGDYQSQERDPHTKQHLILLRIHSQREGLAHCLYLFRFMSQDLVSQVADVYVISAVCCMHRISGPHGPSRIVVNHVHLNTSQ